MNNPDGHKMEADQASRSNPFEVTQGFDSFTSMSQRRKSSGRLVVIWGGLGLAFALAGVTVAVLTGEWTKSVTLNGVAAIFLIGAMLYSAYAFKKNAQGLDRHLLKSILETGGLGKVVTDDIGRIVTANDFYRELFDGKMPSPHRIFSIRANARAVIDELLKELEVKGEASGVIANRPGRVEAALNVRVIRCGKYQVWGFDPIDKERHFRERIDLFQGRISSIMEYFNLGIVIVDETGYVRFMNSFARSLLNKDERNSFILHESELPDWGVEEGGAVSSSFGERFEVNIELDGMDEALGRIYIITPPMAQAVTPHAFDDHFLERVFEESPVAMASVDQSGSILAFNPAMETMLEDMGSSSLEAGDKLSEYWSDGDLNKIMTALAEAYDGVPPKAGVELVCDKGDVYRIVQVYFGEAKGIDNRTINLFMIDTTDQKHLEIQFAQAQKMQAVGQLAGGVAHDFNNLLTAIIGFSDIVLSRYGPRDQSFADLMQIKQNANRAANLVRQLLAFSRQQTMKTEVVSVTDVLDETSDLIRRLLGDNVELRLIHGRDIGPIRFDVGQLEQVIINMAVNARDAMDDDGGVLTIRTQNIQADDSLKQGYQMVRRGEYIRIDIEDTGTGISEDHLSKIFEPFFTTKAVGKGTGLGLSMVYGIIKQSGGYVFADSQLGRGTVFKIYIPRYKSIVSSEVVPAVEPKREIPRDLTGKETVLFIEDEDAVRIFAVRALKNKGYNVLDASSGEAALEILKHHEGTIDLIISDMMMPNMDGSVVVERALKLRPDVKVIMISGYAEDALRKKIDNVSYRFLPKPFSLDELAKEVRYTLEHTASENSTNIT